MKKDVADAYTSPTFSSKVGDSMKEGWLGNDYLILFDEAEAASASDRYAISQSLSGYHVMGLRGWDDFVVRDSTGQTYSLPTVPTDPRYLTPFPLPESGATLSPDPRFSGRIKWYVKPIVFGGTPSDGANLIWVSHEEHAQLVRWWNDLYRSLNSRPQTPV
jgi:hypothetical protein